MGEIIPFQDIRRTHEYLQKQGLELSDGRSPYQIAYDICLARESIIGDKSLDKRDKDGMLVVLYILEKRAQERLSRTLID